MYVRVPDDASLWQITLHSTFRLREAERERSPDKRRRGSGIALNGNEAAGSSRKSYLQTGALLPPVSDRAGSLEGVHDFTTPISNPSDHECTLP